MNFSFNLSGDVARILRKTEKEYFSKAHSKSTDPHKHVHREWIRDVTHLFAGKTHLSFAQAWQAIREGDFTNTRPTHLRLKANTPQTLLEAGKKVDNPLYLELEKIENMQLPDYCDWMRKQFDHAISLSHPLKKVGGRGTSDDTQQKINKSQISLKHEDETRKAHFARMMTALRLHNEGKILDAAVVAAGMLPPDFY